MGSRTKTKSRQKEITNVSKLSNKVMTLESNLSETEVSVFQSVVRLEALIKMLIEKNIIDQEEFFDYVKKTVEFYRSQAAVEDTSSDSDVQKRVPGTGKMKIEVLDISPESKDDEFQEDYDI